MAGMEMIRTRSSFAVRIRCILSSVTSSFDHAVCSSVPHTHTPLCCVCFISHYSLQMHQPIFSAVKNRKRKIRRSWRNKNEKQKPHLCTVIIWAQAHCFLPRLCECFSAVCMYLIFVCTML